MIKTSAFIFFSFIFSTCVGATESLISVESNYSVKVTVDRLESIIEKKGLTLFARIDHQKNAAGVD